MGNLRVLQSKFGTGKLLDGSHELVNTQPIFMDKKLFALSHAIPGKGTLKVSNFVRKMLINFLMVKSWPCHSQDDVITALIVKTVMLSSRRCVGKTKGNLK